MAVKDRDKHFVGLRASDATVKTPNTVSRNAKVGDRAFDMVVWESGKPVLDSELELGQGAAEWNNLLLRRWQTPSGWLRGQSRFDSYCDFTLESAPIGVVDDIPHTGSIGSIGPGSIGAEDAGILPNRTMINCILLPRLEASVAGNPVVVEFTNTRTPGWNLIALHSPSIYDGTDPTVKRTDFLFLEVWFALVAPSPKAHAVVQVVDAAAISAGDKITIDGLDLTATLVPALPNTFLIVPGNEDATAINIANAINLGTNPYSVLVAAKAVSDTVQIEAVLPGAGAVGAGPGGHNTGNFITFSVTLTTPGSMVVSGPLFTGGEDRPNKPQDEQDTLYRHGNVESPAATWLPDEITDPVVNTETTQRVQLQYRIRVTGSPEAVNYKKHPDGFSNLIAGPPTLPSIFAQGGRVAPASNVSGRSYPFVPADKQAVWYNSSAVSYDVEDTGLWIAGDGSVQASKDLGSLDGFIYAIPLCFIFRHNDVSNAIAMFKGFDPVSNANGAPRYQHLGYNGPLGPIPAGKSDRPDGEFSDVITQNGLLDLRRHVIFPGVDFVSEVQYQLQSILDGSTRTWQVDTSSKQDLGGDSGDVSTRFLICNEIGRDAAHGGNNVTSGDTQRGVCVRDFDHVARRFGDQSVVERVVFAFYPGDRISGPAFAPGLVNAGKYVEKAAGSDDTKWYVGDILHLDLFNFDVTTLGGIFQGLNGGGSSGVGIAFPTFDNFAPPGTVITDVLSVFHDDGNYAAAVDQSVQPTVIAGLGTKHLTIQLDTNTLDVNGGLPAATYQMVGDALAPTEGSPRRIFVEVEITYPLGVGATDTPTVLLTPEPVVYDGTGAGPGPLLENDKTQRPNDFEGILEPRFREGFREMQLEYVANDTILLAPNPPESGTPVGEDHPEYIVSRDRFNLYFPRRVFGSAGGPMAHQTTVTDQATAFPRIVDETLTEFGSSSRKVVVSDILSGAGQTLCAITYFPQDPIPNYGALGGGYQVSVYFRANAEQTAGIKEGDFITTGDGVLPTILRIEPLTVGSDLWTGQRGVGSVEEAFPYAAPLDQIPVKDDTVLTKEWYFCATASTTVADFNADTGLLALHSFVQADAQNTLVFGGLNNDEKPRKDAEFRAFYPVADPLVYRPTIMAQPLYGATRHKVIVPILARATEDVPGVAGGLLFRKNELLLVVLSRFAELDDDNTVRFVDPISANRTCAAVYRTRNLLMVVGERNCPPPSP